MHVYGIVKTNASLSMLSSHETNFNIAKPARDTTLTTKSGSALTSTETAC